MSSETNEKSSKSKVTWRKDIIEIVLFLGIAILIVLSFNSVLGLLLNTNSPLVVVTSESMEPIYWGSRRSEFGGEDRDIRKDMLIVRGVHPSEIKTGDTIVFKYINHTEGVDVPIVHRVMRVYQDDVTGEYWFTTKGDNPNSNNAYIELPNINELQIHESRVVGKIVGRIPYLGGIYYYFQTKEGRNALFIGVGVILFIILLFSFFGKDDQDKKESSEVFSDKSETNSSKEEKASQKSSHLTKMKKFYQQIKKQKHFVIPGIMLFLIILVPIIDTLDANWNTKFGVVEVEYEKTASYTVTGGNESFVFIFITMNNPGHWHQKFDGLIIEVLNQTTSEVIGENQWRIVYNFEGEKRISSGAWVDNELLIIGGEYQVKATALLSTKFGRSWTDSLTISFTLN